MHLTKHHGLGNDFLVVLRTPVDAAMARFLCDRRRGLGADGLIGVGPERDGADVTMILHNADGSPAEMTGNGIRCLGQAVARSRAAEVLDLRVATGAGVRSVEVRPGSAPNVASVRVDMGRVGEGPAVVPVEAPALSVLKVMTLDLGNPHLVLLVDDLDTVDPALVGPACARPYADGINVELVAVAGDGLAMKVWERGVGVTEACGTGACAAAVAAAEWGLIGAGPVVVHMPGGDVEVELGPRRLVWNDGDRSPATRRHWQGETTTEAARLSRRSNAASGGDGGEMSAAPDPHQPPSLFLTGPAVFVADIEVPWP